MEPVEVVPYDDSWPERFQRERRDLLKAIGDWAVGGIHHVGSTAVRGLDAKPVIDILVGVEDLESSWPCIGLVAPLGYLDAPYRAREMHWLCKPDPNQRTHHLHIVPVASRRFDDELAFRDLLRADPELRARYAALKHRLAAEFRHDREAYTEGKASFVAECLPSAG